MPWGGETRRLSAKPLALLINFMTARRLRAYLLPTTRRTAPSASSSNARMHAVCMVLATYLSHYIGSYPRCERGAALRTPIDCPSCYFYSQVSHGLYTFSYRICHPLRYLTFPSAQAPPTLSATTVHTGLHSTTTDCNSTTSPSEY